VALTSAQPRMCGSRLNPGVHGRDQGVAADEVHLQSQDAEQQVAVSRRAPRGGGGIGHRSFTGVARTPRTALSGPNRSADQSSQAFGLG
jgi:hypothetical protein